VRIHFRAQLIFRSNEGDESFQIESLKKAGCRRIFREKITGTYRAFKLINANAFAWNDLTACAQESAV
jgi:hypothetical protein